MSDAALAWAWQQKTGSMAAQIVLVRLADRANDDGACHPSQEELASECQTTRQTVNRQIQKLKELGLLEVVRRNNGKQQFSNVYQLRLDVFVTEPPVKAVKPKPAPKLAPTPAPKPDPKPDPKPKPEPEPVVLEPVHQLSIIEIAGGEIQVEKPKPKKKQAAKKVEPKPDPFAIPECLDTPEFREAWEMWGEARAAAKKPLTPQAVKLQLKKLAEWGVDYAIESIHRSIEYRWQGLFPPEALKREMEQDASIVDPFADYQPTEEQIRIATEGIVPCPKCRGANDINMTDTCIYCRTPLHEQAQATVGGLV